MRASRFHGNSHLDSLQPINSLDFARSNKELCGAVSWTKMSRLKDVLANSEFNNTGKLDFIVRGYLDKANRPTLALTLSGACHLCCQRCMLQVLHPVNLTKKLLLVTDSELNNLAIVDEPAEIDYIPMNAHLDVLDLLEEEFLLSLPFAPKHDIDTCDASVAGKKTNFNERKPFAMLVDLKLKQLIEV
ncbi:MAG: YceD family protein [Candidatus Nitrotoga sp.]